MPDWVQSGITEYAARLPREWRLELVELPLAKRGRKPLPDRLRAAEGRHLLSAVASDARLIALDERGRQWTTRQLAERLGTWLQDGRDLVLAIGGPDGLDDAVLARADWHWSLSKLTLPHPLVRIVLLEQLYRAWSLHTNHPYHRA